MPCDNLRFVRFLRLCWFLTVWRWPTSWMPKPTSMQRMRTRWQSNQIIASWSIWSYRWGWRTGISRRLLYLRARRLRDVVKRWYMYNDNILYDMIVSDRYFKSYFLSGWHDSCEARCHLQSPWGVSGIWKVRGKEAFCRKIFTWSHLKIRWESYIRWRRHRNDMHVYW